MNFGDPFGAKKENKMKTNRAREIEHYNWETTKKKKKKPHR